MCFYGEKADVITELLSELPGSQKLFVISYYCIMNNRNKVQIKLICCCLASDKCVWIKGGGGEWSGLGERGGGSRGMERRRALKVGEGNIIIRAWLF